MQLERSQNPQAAHFARLHQQYMDAYYDDVSMAYRRSFINPLLFQDLDLNGKRVADIGCGGGANTKELLQLFPRANLVGFDIASEFVELYCRETGREAHCVDFTRPIGPEHERAFDCVLVIGGLHHMVRGLDVAMENAFRMLKPGGILIALEPSSRFLLEPVRKLWYRADPMFEADTEAAIDARSLVQNYASKFPQAKVVYMGGPAFFMLLQSMILRIPYGVKKAIARPCFAIERMWTHLPFPQLKNCFIIHMRRA
jgi:SAM-dependent methyltransferase